MLIEKDGPAYSFHIYISAGIDQNHFHLSLFNPSRIYIRTPLIIQKGMAPNIIPIMFLPIISRSIIPRRRIIQQTRQCIMAIHRMIDGVFTLQTGAKPREEIQSLVVLKIATEMVRLHLPSGVIAIAGTGVVEHVPFTIAGSFCVRDECEICGVFVAWFESQGLWVVLAREDGGGECGECERYGGDESGGGEWCHACEEAS